MQVINIDLFIWLQAYMYHKHWWSYLSPFVWNDSYIKVTENISRKKLYENEPIYTDFLKFVGPSGQKITRTGNTAKYAGPGVRQKFLFVYFVLHRKSEMKLVCRNDHGQLEIRFCFKWHLLLKHATVSMVILLIIVFL
jgi:hypothetical protein